ncbi:unnamed protein product [Pleuronectes platessa]|uniref:Uncharacterized protein n=1 Tax=Pleuronectes platessa TaxID=8262 RepID=A0A9N7UDW6_PLEPL|nr:unnamed protein product [Pleuronectes platessa]
MQLRCLPRLQSRDYSAFTPRFGVASASGVNPALERQLVQRRRNWKGRLHRTRATQDGSGTWSGEVVSVVLWEWTGSTGDGSRRRGTERNTVVWIEASEIEIPCTQTSHCVAVG